MVTRNVHGDGHFHGGPMKETASEKIDEAYGESIISLFCVGNKVKKVTVVGTVLSDKERVFNLLYDFVEGADSVATAGSVKGNQHAS